MPAKKIIIVIFSLLAVAYLIVFFNPFIDTKTFFQKPYREPAVTSGFNTYLIPVNQQTSYLPLNCVSYNSEGFWSESNQKVDSPYTVIISKSILRNLAFKRKPKENYDLGSYAKVTLDYSSGFDKFGCQKAIPKDDESSIAIGNIFKEAMMSGKTVVVDKEGNRQPTVILKFESAGDYGGNVSFLINDKPFFGTFMWYVV